MGIKLVTCWKEQDPQAAQSISGEAHADCVKGHRLRVTQQKEQGPKQHRVFQERRAMMLRGTETVS